MVKVYHGSPKCPSLLCDNGVSLGRVKLFKRLLKPDTDAERKDAGLDKAGKTGPKIYLCDFCPVKSLVMEKYNKKQGLYN